MRVYRICSRKHSKKAFSGEGARIYGGRWNKPGTPLVYTSATQSLAALELLVHLDIEDLPANLVVASADIPEGLEILHVETAKLPRGWQGYPGPESLQALGTQWVNENRFAVISVPSSIIPTERNFLINPTQPSFSLIIDKPMPFALDSRLWKRNPKLNKTE